MRHNLELLVIRTGLYQTVRRIARTCTRCQVVILDSFYQSYEAECPSGAKYVDYCV